MSTSKCSQRRFSGEGRRFVLLGLREPLRNNLYISFYSVTAPYAVSECLRSTYSLTTAYGWRIRWSAQ